ncbi:MAG: cation-translocating P-type ATPase [Anaerolineae bacterium]|nr:cation-translocating P-type ATPase [Anaerolineae bacterium]
MNRFKSFCVTCARGARSFTRYYRAFLLDPATLVTLGSALLLLLAIGLNPLEVISDKAPLNAAHWLYLAAALLGSGYIWWSAVRGIREGDFTADIPVSLATLAAILIGQYAAAAVVAVLLLVGGLLEEFVAARAGHALEDLAGLLPDRVTVRRPGGDAIVSLQSLQVGEIILVRPGERVAVDGEILSGSATINQAVITGESIAVEKQVGDRVYAGSLNENGALEVRTVQVGEFTTLGQIRRLVAQAQANKAPIERTLDRYARFYTPAAILLGLVLWVWSGDVLRAITVLIVFCPCVMALATPTALVASIGNAAMRGSLVKRGATIEALAKVNTVIFDKTGTLTLGNPQLVDLITLNDLSENELLLIAAAAEKVSEHPLGRSVLNAALNKSMQVPDPEDFEVLTGSGVRAVVGTKNVMLGKLDWLSGAGLPLADEICDRVDAFSAAGRMVIIMLLDRSPAALLVFEDGLRPESKPVLMRLQKMGLSTVLLSGDHSQTVQRVAAELGIDEFYAGVLPQQKLEVVRRLQSEGRSVVFVGDGINDGPALASADVGISMGLGGSDLAIETAEISLLSDDLTRLPHLIYLARLAMRAIRQNLAFSLGVLALAVFLTVLGFLSPVSGALLHELSSIPVIANSARLITLKEENLN